MAKIIIDEELCKGCGLCVLACPKKLIEISADKLNKKGYNPAVVADMGSCSGCAMCATMCPDVAITVEK